MEGRRSRTSLPQDMKLLKYYTVSLIGLIYILNHLKEFQFFFCTCVYTTQLPRSFHWLTLKSNEWTDSMADCAMNSERTPKISKDWFTKYCFQMNAEEWILPKELIKNQDWSLGTFSLATSVKKKHGQCYIYIFILLAALLIACVTVSIGTLSHLEQPVVALLWRY